MKIEPHEVSTTIEALYWITKVWTTISLTLKEKEDFTKDILEMYCENIIREL